MTYFTKVAIIIFMKNTLSIILGLFISINSYAFMSGISPEKDGGPKLEIIKGVIYMGPPNSQVTVGYGIIKNNTDKDLTITGFRSPVYDEVQIHSMEYSDTGTAKMIHNKYLIIPAGKEVVLESGGSHMMLMGPRRDIQAGEIVKMIARDKTETRYMLDLKVIDPRSSHDHDHNHDHHMH